jgi:hypothetical protein
VSPTTNGPENVGTADVAVRAEAETRAAQKIADDVRVRDARATVSLPDPPIESPPPTDTKKSENQLWEKVHRLERTTLIVTAVGLIVLAFQNYIMWRANSLTRAATTQAAKDAASVLEVGQRPWVMLVHDTVSFVVTSEGVEPKAADVRYRIENVGQSPALDVEVATTFAYSTAAPDKVQMSDQRVRNDLTHGVVAQGRSTLQVVTYRGADVDQVMAMLRANAAGTHWLYLRGTITYRSPLDVLGVTTFCAAAPPGTAKLDDPAAKVPMTLCPSGNNAR